MNARGASGGTAVMGDAQDMPAGIPLHAGDIPDVCCGGVFFHGIMIFFEHFVRFLNVQRPKDGLF